LEKPGANYVRRDPRRRELKLVIDCLAPMATAVYYSCRGSLRDDRASTAMYLVCMLGLAAPGLKLLTKGLV